MKRLMLIMAAAFVLCGPAFAQTDQVKTISGGVLNGKAVSLPKPAYPPAARAVNAEGAVSVQVLIDEGGSVVSATAVSGHPLLRPAAVEAAKGAAFSPTMLSGTPVKVSGIITYNFVGSMTPGVFGYELAYAERSGRFGDHSHAKSLAARLPESWASEKSVLESLSYEAAPEAAVVKPSEEVSTGAKVVRDPNKFTVKGDVSFYTGGRKLTAESLEAVRGLQSTAESRFAAEPALQWHFNLGRGLGSLMAELDDDQKLAANAAVLEQLSANAPASVSRDAVSKLNQLIELARAGQPSVENKRAISDLALNLRNLRVGQW